MSEHFVWNGHVKKGVSKIPPALVASLRRTLEGRDVRSCASPARLTRRARRRPCARVSRASPCVSPRVCMWHCGCCCSCLRWDNVWDMNELCWMLTRSSAKREQLQESGASHRASAAVSQPSQSGNT